MPKTHIADLLPMTPRMTRCSVWIAGLAALCLVDSSCPRSAHLESLQSRGTVAGCDQHRGSGCRLIGPAIQGKFACASLPVDPRRAAEHQARLGPRKAPVPVSAALTLTLHSRPSATKKIYLDFDGHVTTGTPWSSSPITTTAFDVDSSPSTFSATELSSITEIWQRVAECYSPFDVDVTTEPPSVADLVDTGGGDTKWGIRVLFGVSNPSPAPNAGGVAYVGGFGWNYASNVDVPCFVFQDGVTTYPKYNADAAIHEIGHTLGLRHDGQFPSSSPSHVEYYEGQGSGNVAWAPHMGASYYVPLVQWSMGEYANPSNTENDLNIITTQNGFTFRPDDHSNFLSKATALSGTVSGENFNVNASGVIEFRTDSDWFKFRANAGTVNISAQGGPANTMLDIELSLYDANGNLITTVNPSNDVIATLNRSIGAGVYYLKIRGAALGDPLTTGYTDYGSLGQYTFTGTYPNSTAAGVPVLGGVGFQFYGITEPPKALNVLMTVTDSNSATLSNATVKISNVVSSQDQLKANLNPSTTGNITSSYNSSNGTLTLTSPGATATVAQFQTALRSVAYSNSSSNPNKTQRVVEYRVSDGTNVSDAAACQVNIGYHHVQASYNSGTNTVTLSDDPGNNSVTLTLQSGRLTVQGNGSTRIGTTISDQPSVTYTVGSSVNLNVNFSGGSDTLSLSGVASPTANINLGINNDRLSLTLCNINTLNLNGGAGTDVVTMTGTTVANSNYSNVP